jgi:hypothetical protein
MVNNCLYTNLWSFVKNSSHWNQRPSLRRSAISMIVRRLTEGGGLVPAGAVGPIGAADAACPDGGNARPLPRFYPRACYCGPASRDTSRCSKARAKMTASSIEDGCWSATSSLRGSLSPVMKSCICCGSVMDESLQERAMNRFANSSTELEQRSIANSPRGESVSSGPKRALTS